MDVVGSPLLKVTVTDASDPTVQESDVYSKKMTWQVSDGKKAPVKVISVAESILTDDTVI